METAEFYGFLRREGLSPRSAALYARTLRTVDARAVRLGVDLASVDVPALDELAELWPWTRSSRQLLRSTLRWWWAFSGRLDGPWRAVRVPGKPPGRCRALDVDEARRLESAARADGGRAGLAVLLALYAGLRRAEIAMLRRDQLSDGWMTIVGKGDRTRYVPIHPALARAIAATPAAGPWVFPGMGGRGHVSPTTVWTYVGRVAAGAGVELGGCHRLRHTCLATALDTTRDLRAVQQLAGHARPETTAIYTRTTRARLAEVVAAIDYA